MRKSLRIAQVAPLIESVPPKRYGGTERVVSYVTEELVRRGHDVTLFASNDSVTDAKLETIGQPALRSDETVTHPLALELLHLEELMDHASEFDVIHAHVDLLFYPFARRLDVPHLSTLHGRLDMRELEAVYRRYAEQAVVSISLAQRGPLPRANWVGNVYHGLPLDLYTYRAAPGDYLAFLGRISPEKRVDAAIRVAIETGVPLRIAAKVDPVDREYFEEEIEPLLEHPLVEFVGEIDEEEKDDFLGEALALIFMIDWPEPFGLAMIEAMACGTPVIARRRGSVPEVVDEGITGLICDDVASAVRCVDQVGEMSRSLVRRAFEQRFSVERMVDDYLRIYENVMRDARRDVSEPPVESDSRPRV